MDKKLISALVISIQVISLTYAFVGVGNVLKDSEPVPELILTLGMVREEGILEVLSTKTNPDGSFNFGELNGSSKYLVSFAMDGKTHRWLLREVSNKITIGSSIKGKLIKKDGAPVAGSEIVLADEFGDVGKTTSDGVGNFVFEEILSGKTYTVKTTMNEVEFTNNAVAPGQIELKILDVATEDLQIAVEDHEIVVQPLEGMLDVYEFIVYSNAGDTVYNNDEIYVALPSSRKLATSNLMDCCFKQNSDHALANPMTPLFPGDTFEVSINYKVPIEGTKYALQKEVYYPTKMFGFFVLADDNEIQVAGNAKEMEFAGKKYKMITSTDVPGKSSMTLDLSGLKTVNIESPKIESPKETRSLPLAIAGVGVLISAFSLIAIAYPRNREVVGGLLQRVVSGRKVIFVAVLLVVAVLAAWGYGSKLKSEDATGHSQEAYEKAVASENKDNPCAPPEGYTEETWRDHIGHHPEQYADCLKEEKQ